MGYGWNMAVVCFFFGGGQGVHILILRCYILVFDLVVVEQRVSPLVVFLGGGPHPD